MNGILFYFHCASNTGYAISRLERVFHAVGRRLGKSDAQIHFAYPDITAGRSSALPSTVPIFRFDPRDRDPRQLGRLIRRLRRDKVDTAFGFDQPPHNLTDVVLRLGGVRRLISYWGAPMSSINVGLKLAVKRLQVFANPMGPDHYVFESHAMQQTGVDGRGIPARKTSIVHLGVDPGEFQPSQGRLDDYPFKAFGIPRERRIVYYSGHMEPRKGVAVLIKALVTLVERGRNDVHLLLLGNQANESSVFAPLYEHSEARNNVTFGGYRTDIAKIIPGCYVGSIASTGWDSFTMSSLEIASCGVPLIVSRLQGLAETVEDGATGFAFTPGNHLELADRIEYLLDRPTQRDIMGAAARARVIRQFSVDAQVEALADIALG